MSSLVAANPMNEFYDKLKEKLRENIADLLPDQALQAMIEKVMQEEFFAKRKTGYGYNEREIRSQFADIVIEFAKPIVAEVVKSRQEEIKQVVEEILNKERISIMVGMAVMDMVKSSADSWSSGMYQLQEVLKRR